MDYMSPERSLDGACRDSGPLFADQDVGLLEHMNYQGGVSQHEPQPLSEGILVDPTDQLPYLAAESVPFVNDEIPSNAMRSTSTSTMPSLKQSEGPDMHMESDMQHNAAQQNIHDSSSEVQITPLGFDVHQQTEVVDVVLPPEPPESNGNDASCFQPDPRHSDGYLGDSMLTDNSSRSYQLDNRGADDDEIQNSSVLHLESEDIRKLAEPSCDKKNETENDQMNGRNASPHDEQNEENYNSEIVPSSLDGMEHEDPKSKNGTLTLGNKLGSPNERSSRLEKGTSSPDRRVLLPVKGSSYTRSSEKIEPQCPVKEIDKLSHSQSPPARRRSRTPEKHGARRKRAASRELSPHARWKSHPEKEARRESRHGDGTPRRRSTSPRRRESPKRRGSPRKRDSPRRRESPRRRDRSKSRSPVRKTESPRHRRQHVRSRSRSPHSRDQHKRSPRRRHSPRRRSPPSSYRRHSPRRPWSPPANRKNGMGKPGRNLFVAGFSYATTERDLEKKFSKYGCVTDVRVVRDKRSGDSRGFGFLSLEKDEDADAAIRAFDETEWNGRIILVEKSKTPMW